MRSDRICRTTFSSALIVLALRQFSTARPSEITPIAKIATPSRTSYRANPYLDLERLQIRLAAMIGVLECWSAGVLKISSPHFSIAPLFHWGSPCRILRKFRLRCERRVIRRPRAGRTSELDGRRFAGSRWPEYPFSGGFAHQRKRQRDLNPAALAETKHCRGFFFLAFCKDFRSQQDAVFAPSNQIRAAFGHTSLLRLAHQLVKANERLLQSPVCDHPTQTGHRQHKQQQQYENTEGNRD